MMFQYRKLSVILILKKIKPGLNTKCKGMKKAHMPRPLRKNLVCWQSIDHLNIVNSNFKYIQYLY